MHDATAVRELFQAATVTLREHTLRRGCAVRLPTRGKLLATGDLHDNINHFRKIVALARLDDSPDNHLLLHELIHGDHLIDGMDFSHRMLISVAQLLRRYPTQVHPVLANHELSQMMKRGVSKGAGNSVELFDDALEYVFGDDWMDVAFAIDEFFAAMPLAVLSEHEDRAPGVLCAHSLPNARMMKSFDMDVLDRELVDEDYQGSTGGATGSAYSMCWGRAYTEESIAQLAQRWNVKLFVLGHQHVETGAEVFGPHVMVLNSDHDRGCVLPIDLANVPDDAAAAMQRIVPLSSVAIPRE